MANPIVGIAALSYFLTQEYGVEAFGHVMEALIAAQTVE
jgi:hypothetical protein